MKALKSAQCYAAFCACCVHLALLCSSQSLTQIVTVLRSESSVITITCKGCQRHLMLQHVVHTGDCRLSIFSLSGAYINRLDSHMKPPTSMGCELTCVMPFRLTVL